VLGLIALIVAPIGLALGACLSGRRPRASCPAGHIGDPYRSISLRPELVRRLRYQAPETWAFWIEMDRRTP